MMRRVVTICQVADALSSATKRGEKTMRDHRDLLPGFRQSPKLRRLGRFLLAGAILAAVLFTAGGSSQVSAASHDLPNPSLVRTLVGKWHLNVTFPDHHVEQSQVVFGQDGVFINITPAPGGGRWFETGGHTFKYLFAETFVSGGVYTTLVEVEQNGVLSADGTSFTASGNGYVYDTTGKLLAINATTTVATRG